MQQSLPMNWFVEGFLDEWEKVKKRYPSLPYRLVFRMKAPEVGGGMPPRRISSVLFIGKDETLPVVWVDIHESAGDAYTGSYVLLNLIVRVAPNLRFPVFQRIGRVELPLSEDRSRKDVETLIKDFFALFDRWLAEGAEGIKSVSETVAKWQDEFLRGFRDGVKRIREILQREGKARIQNLKARLEELNDVTATYNLVVDIETVDERKYEWNFILTFEYREAVYQPEKITVRIDKNYYYTPLLPLSQSLKQLFYAKEKDVSRVFSGSESIESFQDFYAAGLSTGSKLYVNLEKFVERVETEEQPADAGDDAAKNYNFNKMVFVSAVASVVKAALQKRLGAHIHNPPLTMMQDTLTRFYLIFRVRGASKIISIFPISGEIKDVLLEEIEYRFSLVVLPASGVPGINWSAILKEAHRNSYIWSSDDLNLNLRGEEARNHMKGVLKDLGKRLFEVGFAPEYQM